MWDVDGGVGPITYSMLITTWALAVWMILTPIFLPLIVIVAYILLVTLGVDFRQSEQNQEQRKSVDFEALKESVSWGFAMFTLCLGCKCCPNVQARLEKS